ncbi:multidrug resistance-associated protein 1-like isoform X1 [Haliotis rufescens]|uniref:multidrug resistance-associated protein 1-like isoform X1 n=1 Tax=Haliotis rufescens TaxID=6454 RepID=UPI00201F10B2|nr:multidrug resistance-associated protein 1-like isoform X1 [Haliotis rufescens]
MAESFKTFCGDSVIFNESLLFDNWWPEFTPCFQNTLLVWVPCGWLWLTLPFYLGYLCKVKDSKPLRVNMLNTSKMFFSIFLSFICVVDVMKVVTDGEDVVTAVYAARGLQVVTFLLAAILVQVERKRGFITSGIQFIFWLLTTLAGVVPFYSRIIQQEYKDHLFRFVLFYVYHGLVLATLLLHCFADSRKRQGSYSMQKEVQSPETRASFLNRVTFHWINSLLFKGYRKSLEEEDLFELHPRDKSERVLPQFWKAWVKEVRRTQKKNQEKYGNDAATSHHNMVQYDASEVTTGGVSFKSKVKDKDKPHRAQPSFFKVLVKTYGPTLLISHLMKFVYDLLTFVNPLLTNALISFIDNRATEQEWKGYVYACSFFVIALTQSCFFHQHFHISMTLGMRIKSAVISAVYKKALTISSDARKKSTVGEIVNLMSVDCQRLQDTTGFLHVVWSSPLLIAIAFYMLWGILGPSVLAGLGVVVLLFPINSFLSGKLRQYQRQLMKLKDSRIKLMSEVLNGIKVLKLYAWELSFQEKVQDIRRQELALLRKVAYFNAVMSFLWRTAPYLLTLATFSAYILSSPDNVLDAQKAFVSLSLFNILRMPMITLPMIVQFLIQGWVSVSRVSKFLRAKDLDDLNVRQDPHSDAAIKVEQGNFTWDRELPKPTLRKVNLEIPEGKLVAVVGQVGAGKSSLISAMLGEMDKLSGSVTVKSSVAYVPQEAWIQNATLRDNITFGQEHHEKKYKKIVEACALTSDLEILPGKDMIEIGEKGINLSGGQKQRVSLARAIYSDADIYLMDDPLSAVDSHVGKHIFQEVVGHKGILRNKTRLLVTHGVHWLPMTDMVVVLVDGEITEMGTYDELLSHDGAFAQFLKTYLTQEDSPKQEVDPQIQEMKSKIRHRLESVTSDGSTLEDEVTSILTRQTSVVTDAGKKLTAQAKAGGNKLIQEEKSETGRVKFSVFMDYAKAIGGFTTFFIFFIFAIYQAATMASNVWISVWTGDALLKNISLVNTSDYQNKNTMYLGVFGAFGCIQAVVILFYSVLSAVKMVRAASRMHAKMLSRVLRSPMSFFDTTPIGRIVNRFSRDVETVDNNLPALFRMWINCVFNVTGTLIVISYSTPIFLSVIIPLAILYYLVQRFYIQTSRQLKRLESTTRSPIYSHFGETITGASSIRAYNVTDRFIMKSSERVDKNLTFFSAWLASNRWLGVRLEFLGNTIVLFAALFSVITTNLPSGIVGLSVSYALQITQSLSLLVRMTSDIEANIVSVERMKEYSEIQSEAEWIVPSRQPPRSWPDEGKVTFDHYETRYRSELDLVLKGISCDINGGEKIGIVGRTGAGKSSLTVALFRLIEAAGGRIIVDGRAIDDMGLHDLRSKLTILPQDPVIFSGTLRMNLDPFDSHSDEDLWQALEHAHLKTFVTELPSQLEYECGEGGQNLSVGQRQLVCLARTLLRKTKILVLDEATAAVDMETDDLIQTTIKTEFRDSTVITIAHRLNTIMDYDRILVLDQGLVKEFDTPAALLTDKQSVFYGMAKDANLV